MALRKGIWGKLPVTARVLLYYLLIFPVYRFLVHGYLDSNLEKQLMGAKDTLLVTTALLAYLVMCLLAPYFWARASQHRSLSRGLESFMLYCCVFLVLGELLSFWGEIGWSAWYGIALGSGAGERTVSVLALFLLFMVASRLGGRSSSRRMKRTGRKATRRKGRSPI